MTNRNQRFPSAMKVVSPQIDSIERTARRMSNWMHNDFKEAIKPLQTLPEIPGILRDFQERMVEQFRDQLAAQMLAQMKTREAGIQSAESKAEFLEGRIERERTLLEEQRESLKARYGDMLEDTAREHSSFLSQLDGHAYRIADDIWRSQIREKFVSQSQPFWARLAARASESAFARSSVLERGCIEAERALSEFLRDRVDALAAVKAMDAGIEEGDYELPYWYAAFEDEDTGEISVDVMFADGLEDSELGGLLTRIAIDSIESRKSAAPDFDLLESARAGVEADGELAPEDIARFREHCERLAAENQR